MALLDGLLARFGLGGAPLQGPTQSGATLDQAEGGFLGQLFGGGGGASPDVWGMKGMGSQGLLGAGANMLAAASKPGANFGEVVGAGLGGGIAGMGRGLDMQEKAAVGDYRKSQTEVNKAAIAGKLRGQDLRNRVSDLWMDLSNPGTPSGAPAMAGAVGAGGAVPGVPQMGAPGGPMPTPGPVSTGPSVPTDPAAAPSMSPAMQMLAQQNPQFAALIGRRRV